MHSNAEGVLGWVVIGLCASLIAMAWPTRRGKSIAANFVTGVLGAVTIAFVGHELHWSSTSFSDASFGLAAVGAVSALLVMHAVWARAVRARSSRRRGIVA